ncbi:MAG: hypothetical protein AB7O60_03325 [Variibacter sp.]
MIDANVPQSCVLTTQETSGPPDEPTTVDVPHACSGWVDTYDTAERANGDVLVNDRKVYILASSLDVTPAPGNTVTVDGATFSIISVQRDPAGAAWVCQCRV